MLRILALAAIFLGPVAIAAESSSIENITYEEVDIVSNKRSFIMSLSFLNQSQVDVKGDVDSSELDDRTTGLGFAFEYNLNSKYGLEVGLFNIKRRYVTTNGDETLAQETQRAHFPVLVRGWLWDNISLGLGPFASFRTSKVKSARSANSENLDTQASDEVEFGIETAATLNITYGDKTGIFLESRWSEPFNQREEVEINQFTALAGVKVEVEL